MSKRNPKDLNEGETRLFLEKTPSAENRGEFDEIVPEFMHRAFYRSTEDELHAVEPSGRLKAVRTVREGRPRRQVSLPPLPPMSAPDPAEALQPLQPLRTHSGQLASEPNTIDSPEDEEVDSPPFAPEPRQSVLPRPVVTSSLNLPLVACLLFVVGLLLWREQTRPPLGDDVPLPIPQVVRVSEDPTDAPVLGEEGPYPDMTAVSEETDLARPDEQQDSEELVSKDPEALELSEQTVVPEADEAAEETITFPTEDASAQRAAILNRRSSARESEEGSAVPMPEPEAAPAATRQSTSLFPASVPNPSSAPAPAPASPVTEPAPPVVTAPVKSEPAASVTNSTSLFPTESTVPTRPKSEEAVDKPKPVAKPPQTPRNPQGKPYQIAEPSL